MLVLAAGLLFLPSALKTNHLAWARGEYDVRSAWAPGDLDHPESREDEYRFVDNKDGTVTDTKTNLMWAKNGRTFDFLAAVTWQDALKKLESIDYGGHRDWRLPTLIEWKTLIDTTRVRPALVEPNPFENVVVHLPYWSATEFIFGPEYTCINVCPIHAYTVSLWHGTVGTQNKNKHAFVLPVRSLGG